MFGGASGVSGFVSGLFHFRIMRDLVAVRINAVTGFRRGDLRRIRNRFSCFRGEMRHKIARRRSSCLLAAIVFFQLLVVGLEAKVRHLDGDFFRSWKLFQRLEFYSCSTYKVHK